MNKYKKIYQERVLPKKSVIKGTPETFQKTLDEYNEFSVYKKRANEVLLGGGFCGKK